VVLTTAVLLVLVVLVGVLAVGQMLPVVVQEHRDKDLLEVVQHFNQEYTQLVVVAAALLI
jgi:hypothetical protein